MILNHQLFAKKSVLVVNGRTGICGITARKFTKCNSVVMTQFLPEIIENVRNNCQKNALDDERVQGEVQQQKQNNLITILKFNMQDIAEFEAKYDLIFIVDPFCKGFPFKEFYHLLIKFLSIGGTFVGVVPEREDDREKLFAFINEQNEISQKNKTTNGQNQYELFELEVTRKEKELSHQEYFSSPLPNLVEGLNEFPGISQTKYSVYHIVKTGAMEQFESEKLEKKEQVEVVKKPSQKEEQLAEKVEVNAEQVKEKLQELQQNQEERKHVDSTDEKVEQVVEQIKEPQNVEKKEEIKQESAPEVQAKE